jgi:hypothetical protein
MPEQGNELWISRLSFIFSPLFSRAIAAHHKSREWQTLQRALNQQGDQISLCKKMPKM